VNLEELSFLESLEEQPEEENFEVMLEREKEKVREILQSLEPNRLKEN
jgi:hypothetical protein